MALLLCGFAGFLFSQLVKTAFRKSLPGPLKLWMALGASVATAALLYPHQRALLAAYGVAGGGLAVLVHRKARLASVAGDLCIRTILWLRARR